MEENNDFQMWLEIFSPSPDIPLSGEMSRTQEICSLDIATPAKDAVVLRYNLCWHSGR